MCIRDRWSTKFEIATHSVACTFTHPESKSGYRVCPVTVNQSFAKFEHIASGSCPCGSSGTVPGRMGIQRERSRGDETPPGEAAVAKPLSWRTTIQPYGGHALRMVHEGFRAGGIGPCLLYTSDAADEEDSVDLGGRRIIKKK